MVKVEILTDTTIDGLHRQINDWASNGWRLHESIVLIQWKDVKELGTHGQAVTHATACGFLQVMTRTEGTCRTSRPDHEGT